MTGDVTVLETSALAEVTRGEVDVQVRTAKTYPRDIELFKSSLMTSATIDKATAESCNYSLPRGGNQINGPSIRLAEMVVQHYGNLRVAIRLMETGGKVVTAQAVGWDMESNIAVSSEVDRRIVKSDGTPYDDDMVVVTGNAAKAIAYRNVVFKLVPWSLVKPVYDACLKIAGGAAKDVGAEFKKSINYFQTKHQRGEADLLRVVGKKKATELTTEDIATLSGLAQSIKDGETTVDKAFAFEAVAEPGTSAGEDTKPAEAAAPTEPAQDGAEKLFETPADTATEATPEGVQPIAADGLGY